MTKQRVTSALFYMVVLFRIILLVFCIALANTVYANTHSPFARHWDTTGGLSHNSVYDINQDPLGRAWLATPNGVDIVDGLGVTNLQTVAKPNLKSNVITRVISHQNVMYVLSLDGIDIVDPYTFKVTHVNDDTGLLKRANHLIFTDDLSAYIVASNKLIHWSIKDNIISKVTLPAGVGPVSSISQIADDLLMLSTKSGVYSYNYKTNDIEPLLSSDSLLSTKDRRYAFIDKPGRLWISVYAEGVYIIENKKVVAHFEEQNGLASNLVSKIFAVDEHIYVLTRRGMSVYDQTSLQMLRTILPKSNNNAYLQAEMALTAFNASAKQMWIGTTNGFYSLNQSDLGFKNVKYSNNSRLFGNVFSLNSQLFSVNEHTITAVNLNSNIAEGFQETTLKTPIIMSDENLIITVEGSIYEFSAGKLNKLIIDSQVDQSQLLAVYKQQKHNEIIAVSWETVYLFSRLDDRLILKESFYLGNINIADIKKANHKLYIASQRQGLLVIDLEDKKSNLKTAKLIKGPQVPVNLYLDREQRLWLQSLDNGIFYIDQSKPNKANHVNLNRHFQSECMVTDKNNNTWLVSAKGISILAANFKYNDWIGDGRGFNPEHVGITSCGNVDGQVFIATTASVYIFNAFAREFKKQPQTLGISAVSKDLNFVKYQNEASYQQPSLLSFLIYSDDLLQSKNAQLQFRIKNLHKQDALLDAHWNEAQGREIKLLQPTSGEYLLEFRLITPDGIEILNNTSFFEVQPPFYRRSEMLAVYIFIFFALVITLFVKKLRAKNKTLYETQLASIEQQKYGLKLAKEVREKTEQYRIQRQLAVKANIDKTRFIASASHDLRVPLNAIRWKLKQLIDDSSPDKEPLMEEIQMLDNLVESIVNLAKFDAKQITANPTSFALSDFIIELQKRFNDLAIQYKVTLTFKNHGGKLFLFSDRFLLSRLVNNLIDNAIKNTQTGGVVTVEANYCDKYLALSVKDTGQGLPASVKSNLYSTFVRGTDHYRGTGLGLAIVKQIADVLDVPIRLQSNELGTEFTLQLPLCVSQNNSVTSVPSGVKNVLVIDNDAFFANELSNSLSQLGFAADTLVVIDIERITAAVAQYKVVMFDYNLGIDETGLELAKKLHSLKVIDQQLVIIMSEDASLRQLVRETSDFIFLSKPIKKNKLSWVIQSKTH